MNILNFNKLEISWFEWDNQNKLSFRFILWHWPHFKGHIKLIFCNRTFFFFVSFLDIIKKPSFWYKKVLGPRSIALPLIIFNPCNECRSLIDTHFLHYVSVICYCFWVKTIKGKMPTLPWNLTSTYLNVQ